jgi:hypothetical protein
MPVIHLFGGRNWDYHDPSPALGKNTSSGPKHNKSEKGQGYGSSGRGPAQGPEFKTPVQPINKQNTQQIVKELL